MSRYDLYCEALDSANKVLELTKGLLLTGEPSKSQNEIKRFVRMVEQREPLIQKLVQLRRQALTFPEDKDKEKSEAKWLAVQLAVKEINIENKKKMEVIDKIKTSVMSTIKDTRDSAKLNKGYTVPTADLVSGLLDIRN